MFIELFFVDKFLLAMINPIAIYLVFLVYLNNPKEKINKLFSLLTILLLIWVNGGYFFNTAQDLNKALFLGRLLLGIVFIFLIVFYIFSLYFPKEKEKKFKFKNLIFSIVLIIFLLITFSNLVVVNVEFTGWGINPIYNLFGKIFFYSFIFCLSFLILKNLFKKYFILPQKEKIKIQYLLIGIFIFLIMNLVFNVFLPLYQGTIKYWQFGNYSAIFLLGFTALAIVKRELFGIRVVLTGLFVGLIGILLLLDLLIFTEDPWIQIAKIFILILFLGLGYTLIKSVILEIKRREELENLTSQLETANIKLTSAYKKLEILDKAKSEFISIASHQLRTPLTAIKGYLSMVLEKSYGKVPEKIEKPLESVYISNERLIKLVNDLLSISRIEAGKIGLKLGKFSIEKIIFEVIKELKIIAEKKKIYLKFEKSALLKDAEKKKSLSEILIDGEKIREVVMNVIDNALRYTEKGGIKVKLEMIGDKLQIIITDTGEGMTKEEIFKLFETFSRGTAGTRFWTEGAGLGLYISRKFVEMHEG